jgi:threonylcarbamoyladenosine tRNA methylthiotransferase MtaB
MKNSSKTFLSVNFGCRVNSAETNLWSQKLIDQGYIPAQTNPDIILVNTCSVTKKGEYESISKIKKLSIDFPKSKIIATGCANLKKVKNLKNVSVFDNSQKEDLLSDLNCQYTHKIGDKFSHTHRYLLKIQSGCTANCSYCTVPSKRPYLWSLPIDTAVNTVNQAVKDGYQEIIITGVNIDQYQYGLSNLILFLLKNTSIPLISFGSIPINSVDDQFIKLYHQYPNRLSHFLHLPIQSGSDKILKLMHRPYNVKKIKETFNYLKSLSPLLVKGGAGGGLSFGTDIIVGFSGETESDFQDTFNLCQSIGFTKIHVFKFSPRPNTPARKLFLDSPKISKEIIKNRSQKIRSLTSQTTLPFHQTPEI